MKKLSKEEMKMVMGGVVDPTVDTVYCNDGSQHDHPTNNCSGGTPSYVCEGREGFKICTAWGHPGPVVPE